MENEQQILSELAQAKAVFQARTVRAVLTEQRRQKTDESKDNERI